MDPPAGLARALVQHHFGDATAMSSQGYAAYIQERPDAKIYFRRDQLGALLVEYVFDGNLPVRYEYSPIDPLAALNWPNSLSGERESRAAPEGFLTAWSWRWEDTGAFREGRHCRYQSHVY
ncbi:hypothetical protein [Mycobacterium sp. AT1]|uniref:hypothetical protein n=1 Tax=Mycobacterium sp. AT1 TaxID=1961706 RepID=UPI0009ADBC4B|nr:hypothetical protein [Mycobacterium sp. AT1]OPX05899.1 hypothetical protein B1790_29980 [Mycobacterium sp. AT1]